MRRLAASVAVSSLLAVVVPNAAEAALFFLFDPTSATPGERVAIRTGGTPIGFKSSQRARPFQQPMRLYLVRNAVAASVTSRRDPRLHFIGSLVPDKNGHGVLVFDVPRLKPDAYAVAVVCPGCARYSSGRTFFVLHVDAQIVPRFRPMMLLRVKAP